MPEVSHRKNKAAASGKVERAPEVAAALGRVGRAKTLLQVSLLLADLLAGSAALLVATQLHRQLAGAAEVVASPLWPAGGLLVLCWVVGLFLAGLYTLRPPRPVLTWAFQLAQGLFGGTMAAVAVFFLLAPWLLLSRDLYLLATLLAWGLTGLVRVVAVRLCPPVLVRERVLVVGTGPRAESLVAALLDGHNPTGAQVLGAVTTEAGTVAEGFPCPVLGPLEECLAHAAGEEANSVVITAVSPLPEELARWAARCDAAGLRVLSMESAYEELTRRAPIFNVGRAWEASLDSVRSGKYATRLKRLLDVTLTVMLLPLALLIIGLSALAIKLTSRGGVFYHQERVGKDGEIFTFTKLRTMVEDAERATGPVWAQADDPRTTPVGRVLRKLRLDELPQLFSVLRGDMSLVGPRPERPHFVEQFKGEIPLYEKRLMVRPGITGWAQVHQSYDRCLEDVIEKLRYDLYYIRHLSLSLDLQIILKTIGVMLGRRGAH